MQEWRLFAISNGHGANEMCTACNALCAVATTSDRMGLKSGPNGAKAQFKSLFSDAFRDFSSLSDAREVVGVSRSETLAVVDGNVMLMQVPTAVDTFPAFVKVIVNQIYNAIKAAEHVVVVFDEPKCITKAKAMEQAQRDARRSGHTPVCSSDLSACPTSDAYDRECLSDDRMNVRLLMNHRAARPRFYDAVCVAVLEHFNANLVQDPNSQSYCKWSLTFDGIDGRGADRPQSEQRNAGILSSNADVWATVLQREHPVGEGDLKLTDVCDRVHKTAMRDPEGPLGSVVLNLIQTIDTDSLLIELMQESRRACRACAKDRNELTLLCLRECARKRTADGNAAPAYFQCVDMQIFYDSVTKYLLGRAQSIIASSVQKRQACALFAASVALCGCDFIKVEGLSAHLMIPEVKHVVRSKPEMLGFMEGVFTGHAGSTLAANTAIQTMISSYASALTHIPRMKKAVEKVMGCDGLQILRATWVVSYWLGNEFKDVHQWGFPSMMVEDPQTEQATDLASDAPLTEGEYKELVAARPANSEAWARTVDAIKARRGGVFPPDWYAKIVRNTDKFNLAVAMRVISRVE